MGFKILRFVVQLRRCGGMKTTGKILCEIVKAVRGFRLKDFH